MRRLEGLGSDAENPAQTREVRLGQPTKSLHEQLPLRGPNALGLGSSQLRGKSAGFSAIDFVQPRGDVFGPVFRQVLCYRSGIQLAP